MDAPQVFSIGGRVDQMCITCGEERGHIIASLSKKGKITRVSCATCGSRVAYKAGTSSKASTNVGAPYDRTRTYRRGQSILHPTFGEGEITAVVEPGKIDVLFADRIRRLVHGTV